MPRRRGAPWAGALLLLVALQGCFTAGLWGFEVTSERDPITHEEQASFEARDGEELGSVWFRILATPLSLVLDDLEKRASVERAYAKIAPMFWGPRIPLDEACNTIRAWVDALRG